jgi:hypothetical protein
MREKDVDAARALGDSESQRVGTRLLRIRLVDGRGTLVVVEPAPHVNVVEARGLVYDAVSALRYGTALSQCSSAEFELSEGSAARDVHIRRQAGGPDSVRVDGGEPGPWRPVIGEGIWVARMGDALTNMNWACLLREQSFVPGRREEASRSARAAFLSEEESMGWE